MRVGASRLTRDGSMENRYGPSYDPLMCSLIMLLLLFGLVMITSASTSLGERLGHDPMLFAKRHACYLLLSLLCFMAVMQIPVSFWQRSAIYLLLLSILLLLSVLVIGETVNGSCRWLRVGFLRIQPAELTKLALFCYLADYLVRKLRAVRDNFWDFCKPLTILLILALLLLAQPDLGSAIVLFVTSLTLFFLAGVKIWQILAIVGSGGLACTILIIFTPYRFRRITAFLDPWSDPYGSGYQLTQSLMAFGRGGYFGQGLGNSIQKLDYLPAAHTDFIFAILAEELGYFGVVTFLGLFTILVARMGLISYRAMKNGSLFGTFFVAAVAIWLVVQMIINIGGTLGLLPTKGLTLPLISYGGSSLLVFSIALSIVVRVDFEERCSRDQAYVGRRG